MLRRLRHKLIIIGRSWRMNELGFSPVSLAVTLPVLLLLAFSAIELFLYMRTVGIVSRAAGEAAQVMAAANPQGQNEYSPNSFSASPSSIVTSKSGGLNNTTVEEAFAEHGAGYGDFADATALPFPLARAKSPSVGAGDPGVMYLPLARVYTCLRPRSEDLRTIGKCSTNADTRKESGVLTYQLPAKLDFDGDGSEDLAFFDQNDGPDWWIIPSSSGSFFRYAMSFESAPAPSAGNSNNRPQWLPCPADYDGDAKTDICATAVESGKVKIRLRLSTQYYFPNPEIELDAPKYSQIAPVSGQWSVGTGEQFALVVLEATDQSYEMQTLIYPRLTEGSSSSFIGPTYTIDDSPTVLSETKFKPRPGSNFRPAFGDHDGDGILDVGWLEWPGGNLTYRIAGSGEGVTSSSDVDARGVKMRPWGVYYSPSGLIFIIERLNHRVSILLPNETQPGKLDTEVTYRRIMGVAEPTIKEAALGSPNPSYLDPYDPAPVPIADEDNGCDSCPSGGNFSTKGDQANEFPLNTPTDVVDTAIPGKPLFIADYGNYRIHRLDPGPSSYVKAGTESVATEVGGAATTDCATNFGAGPTVGGASVAWNSYPPASQASGIHPSCVAIRPLSLELKRTNPLMLLVGDARGAIFGIDPGVDQIFNAESDASERMYLIAGIYGKLSKAAPASGASPTATPIGQPVDMALASVSGTPILHIVIQNSGLPAAGATSTGPANTGGVVRVSAGADKLFGTADDVLLSNWGDFIQQDTRPRGAYTASSPAFSIRNPTAIAMPATLSNIQDGIFITGWWNHEGDEPYENSLLRLVRSSTATGATAISRWVNREHSNGWGMVAPNEPSTPYSELKWSTALPISVLPVLPGSGVGLDSSGKILVFAEPTRGQVMATLLDHDGDGILDPSDVDIDGDGNLNTAESNLTMFQVPYTTEPFLLDDPIMWANGTSGSIKACTGSACADVDGLSWWIDRLSMRSEVPITEAPIEVGLRDVANLLFSTASVGPPIMVSPLPTAEEGMFLLFNDSTVAIPNGRGAIVNGEVYAGGPDRATEIRADTSKPLLAPLVMGSTSPSEDQLKSVKGFDHCAWGLSVFDSSMNSTGEPVTTCDSSSSERAGVRRVHLAQWTNQWHPWGAGQNDTVGPANEIAFLDWDGDGVRNPVVYKNDVIAASSKRPLIAHIGNIDSSTTCPGSFGASATPAIDSLAELLPILSTKLTVALTQDSSPQFACNNNVTAFSAGTTHTVSVMADTHAEWKVYNESISEAHSETSGDRLSLGADGDGDPSSAIGPVAETAYQVLERSLKVTARENDSDANGAKVTFSAPTPEGLVTVTVSYVYPFNTFVRSILGMKQQTLTAQITRRTYQ